MAKFKVFMKEIGSVVILAILIAAVLKLFIIDSRVVDVYKRQP